MQEIDGVTRAFEATSSGAGDSISDDFMRVVELSTAQDLNTERLARPIQRINRSRGVARVLLERAGMVDTYHKAIDQINEMNGIAEGDLSMRLLPVDTEEKIIQ